MIQIQRSKGVEKKQLSAEWNLMSAINSVKKLPFVVASWALVLSLISCTGQQSMADPPKGKSEYIDGVHHFVPTDGFVPDARTAERIAEAVLLPIYGQQTINEQRPLVAELRKDAWVVTGTLKDQHLGGVAIVELAKADGRILRVSHDL